MNKKDTYNQGYDTGYNIADTNITELNADSWNEDVIEKFVSDMLETESDSYRQYSPFEFFAHDINECWNSEGLWDSYDNGVYKGILARVKEFKKDNKKGYSEPEKNGPINKIPVLS
jgi:hypothetical protein